MISAGVILIADDDAMVRETLADLLDIDRFKVIQAADAAEALMVLRGPDVQVDILVTDLSMPGIDGIALIERARQIKPNLPAILLTGYADQVESVTMTASGGFHVLRKPVQAEHLVRQIQILLGRIPGNT